MTTPVTFQCPNGHVVVTTHGTIQADTHRCLSEMRSFTEKQGLRDLRWVLMPGSLVDKARNDACRGMLSDPGAQWLLFIDADMTFPQDALIKLLTTAYQSHPWADVVGGYCNLRGDQAIPTMDTGTGTWESHYPNAGVIEVIRTGAAFLLVKRHVCERIPQPWFALRVPMRPIDAFAEIDNFARIKMDGTNPLRDNPAWVVLERIASQDPSSVPGQFQPAEVGEDSGFCDRVRHAGMRIVVNTDVVTGHLGQTTFNWETHREAMEKRKLDQRHLVGLLA